MSLSVTLAFTEPGTPLVLPSAYSARSVARSKVFCLVVEGVEGSGLMRRGVASAAGRFFDEDGVTVGRCGVEVLGAGVTDDRIGTRVRAGVGVSGSLLPSSTSITGGS